MSVLVQRSSVSQTVPQTVAEAHRPFVTKLPLPFPQRRRTRFGAPAADVFRLGQVSGSESVRVARVVETSIPVRVSAEPSE
jgi:hypothetical protein